MSTSRPCGQPDGSRKQHELDYRLPAGREPGEAAADAVSFLHAAFASRGTLQVSRG